MIMAKQEITLKGLDGHEDHLVYDVANGQVGDSLEECARSLFPREGETMPRLRFQGFEGEWEKAKASDLFVTFNDRNRPDLPVLSACQDIRGMAVRSESGYDISHDRSNEVTYKVVKPGQFVIHLRSFQGGFAHSAVEGITSPAYTVFGFKNPERHEDYFWKIIFMSKAFIKRLETITYGIRDGRSISFEEFSNMDFLFPSYEEQKAIATFFRRLDAQIALRKDQFERLQQVKSACLESMFPRGAESAPPIRFKGFNDEWITVRFGDMIKECLDKSTVEDEDILLSSSIEGMFLNSELFGHQRGRSNIGYRKLRKNMLVLSAQNLHLGNANVNLRFEHGLVSPAYKIYDIFNCSPNFMYHWIKRDQTKKFFLDATTAGASLCRKNIVWNDLYNQNLQIPSTIEEQEKIGSFFHSLDKQLSTEQNKLNQLKQMKSACLRSMFPQNGGGYFTGNKI